MNAGPFRTPAPGAIAPESHLQPAPPPREPARTTTPIEDVRVPVEIVAEPLTSDEADFWKSVYIATIPKGLSGMERSDAADKAVLRLRKRTGRR